MQPNPNKRALPPVYRDIKRLLVMVENAVQGFSRYHRYTLGTDLRQQALKLMRLVHRAWRDQANVRKHLQSLVWALDDFRLSLQLAKELHAFPSFALFEQLARLGDQVGRQCGGWLKSVAPTAQRRSRQ